MFVPILYCALQLSAPSAMPDRLIGLSGVEYVQDPQVFTLFSALNAAGYSAERRRAAPPLDAPVYDPIRVKLRAALRAPAAQAALKPVRGVFSAHPAPIERYLEASLSGSPRRPAAQDLRRALRPALAAFEEGAGLGALSDSLAEAAREEMKALKEAVDQDLKAADARMRAPRALSELTVLVNPLDAHGSLRRLHVDGRPLLIVGPGLASGRMAVVAERVAEQLAGASARAFAKAPSLRRRWAKLPAGVRARYKSGPDYLAHALGWAIAAQAAGVRAQQAEDAARAAGLRWLPQARTLLQRYRGRRPLAQALPRLAKSL